MNIIIINLKRSTSRRLRIEREMKRVRLSYKFFNGVDGLQLTKEEVQTNIDPNHRFFRQFNKGEIGCFLSHYSVYKKIVDDNLPYALILEDDIIISPRLPELLRLIESQINQGDVISLYSSFPEPCRLYKEKDINQNYYITKPHEVQLVMGTVAYVITLKAAENMVRNMLPMDNVVDDWRYWLQKKLILDFKIVFPHPVDVIDTYSDVTESVGGLGLRIKKMIVNNDFPILANIILKRRRSSRWQGRRNNIIIDGQKPKTLFY